MTDRIFVNYRQRGADGRLLPHVLLVESLADRLATHFGRDTVYLDTTLRPGEPYPDALRARVADATVLVVVIHPGWLADLAARTDRRTDWVHEEIATALAHGTRLLPVVLDGAELPNHDLLPPAIRPLADAQAITLRFGSLADGLAAATAEIELIVAPDVPEPVASVAPLPDRGRLAAVLALFAACGLLTALAAVTDALGFTGLPAYLTSAVVACVPLLYLVVILTLTACMYTIRRPMAWVDERLVRTPHRAYVVFGFGVLVVALCHVALMTVEALRSSADAFLLTIAASTGILILMGVLWLRNQEQTPQWPHAPAHPTPIWVRKALVDLEHHLDKWQAPLPLRQQREALVALSVVRGALATMSSPASRTLLAWWRTCSPWITLPHSTMAGAAVALATTALALHWHAEGPGMTSALWWLCGIVLAVGAYGGSLIFEHRRLQWQIRTIAETTPIRLAELEERLAELSRPGLIAVHHTRT